MSQKRVTMADIARRAGTHVTTVSLALRQSPRLSAATRDRINRLAKEMGYRPDPWMRALVSYRDRNRQRRSPPVLAYVTNWNTRWGWKQVTAHPEFYRGAQRKADELGFLLDHFWLREPGLTHGRLSRIFETRGIAGLIIASHVREVDESLEFEWENFSAVKIDYFPHHPALFTVTNNHLHIIRLAMRRVMAAGYRRIALVMDRGWDETVDHHWSCGFSWEQRELDPADRIEPFFLPALIWEEKATEGGAVATPDLTPHLEGLKEWLVATRPEVVISKDQFVFPAFEELGWRVPEDVAFVDLFLGDHSRGIAGVRQNHETVGALAVETVAAQVQHHQRGLPKVPTTSLVEGTWHDGASLPERRTKARTRAAKPRKRRPSGRS